MTDKIILYDGPLVTSIKLWINVMLMLSLCFKIIRLTPCLIKEQKKLVSIGHFSK